MPKSVLITGIGGSAGCHVFRHVMVNTDWDVVGIDSFRHRGLTDRIYAVTKKHPETHHRFKIFTHDLRAPISDLLSARMGEINYVINLASISDVDVSISDPTGVLIDNMAIAANIFEYARLKRIDAFLHVSTDEVYGPTDGKTAHAEWSPIIPSNPYSASKAAQEAAAICYWRTYSLPLILVNVMNMYGEMQSPAKFPAMVQRMVRAGETVKVHQFGTGKFGAGDYGSRFYIHSRNAADAMLFLLERVKPYKHQAWTVDRPDRFNIVGSEQVSNLQLAKLIARFIGKPLKWEPMDCTTNRPGHDVHYGLDGAKLAGLGWTPPHTFEWSLQQTVLWYERNPQWLTLK